MFAIAAETGWPEERVLFMPLARLAQYQHCLLRSNAVRTRWSSTGETGGTLREQLEKLRMDWGVMKQRESGPLIQAPRIDCRPPNDGKCGQPASIDDENSRSQ